MKSKLNYIAEGLLVVLFIGISSACSNNKILPVGEQNTNEQLLREHYVSAIDNKTREFLLYLPTGYGVNPDKKWPVILFLHGNGERGNGKGELGFVLAHGPLYEAWIQKKNLPFIIIAPQLPMFDWDKKGIEYIDNRSIANIPKRMVQGVPARPKPFVRKHKIKRTTSLIDMTEVAPLLPQGWDLVETDLINILDFVENKYLVDPEKEYLSGLSYGGFGTWYLASRYPNRFAAIAPVVGWGHPSLMEPIAKYQLPVWGFAGGRDSSVAIENFYAGLNKLEDLGHKKVRFTVHEDKGHDAWTRVYSGDDLYRWFLTH